MFAPLLVGLQSRYPDVELELHADDSRSDFAAEDIDLAFRTGPADKGRLISAALPPARRAPYASPTLLEQVQDVTRPADLLSLPCVLRTQEPGKWEFKNNDGRQEDVTPPIRLRVNTMELAYAVVKKGHAAAMLPTLLAQQDERAGNLVRLLPDWFTEPVPLTLLCRPERLAAPQVAAVRQFILEACKPAHSL